MSNQIQVATIGLAAAEQLVAHDVCHAAQCETTCAERLTHVEPAWQKRLEDRVIETCNACKAGTLPYEQIPLNFACCSSHFALI